MNIKQILSLFLFMIFTTTIVNAHALSHLFDDDFNSIEHCNTCDEFTLTSSEDNFITPEYLFYKEVPHFHFYSHKSENSEVNFTLVDSKPAGKYYNKPPPLN